MLLKNGRLIDPASNLDAALDVRIDVDRIAEVGKGLKAGSDEVIELDGLVLAPGFVDLHTHLREPGREDAETVDSGTKAAALGGFTAVCAMANTDPVADSAAVVEQVFRLGRAAGNCDVFPVGAITQGLKGERLSEMGEMVHSAANVRFFSDDGKCVNDSMIMRRAMEYARTFDALIANHSEEASLAEGWQMNEGEVSALLGMRGLPSEAEEIIVARDLALARLTGGRLHIPHVSTAGTVDLLRDAKRKGLNVSAEVTPHHLSLSDECVNGFDPVFKVAPPLRSKADIEAVREALEDGTIDCVATDHAPHAKENKDVEFDAAPCGMIGLETALGVLIAETGLDMTKLVVRLSVAPARIRRLQDHGGPVVPGHLANLVVFDPEMRWTVDPHAMASRSRNSPFAGRELTGKVIHTIYQGTMIVRQGGVNGQR